MVKCNVFIALLMLVASEAWACNPAQGSGQCGFYDATGRWVGTRAEYDASFQQQGRATYNPPPPGIWEVPSGVWALCEGENTFASAYNMNSKREARQKALRECQPGKKQPCKIFTEYANGCVSFVQGRKGKLSTFIAEGSPERGYAYYKAMNKCSANHDKCTVLIEEECSIAEPPR